MIEWDLLIQELKADRPANVPGWEPVSVAAVQAAISVRLFVLLRRPR